MQVSSGRAAARAKRIRRRGGLLLIAAADGRRCSIGSGGRPVQRAAFPAVSQGEGRRASRTRNDAQTTPRSALSLAAARRAGPGDAVAARWRSPCSWVRPRRRRRRRAPRVAIRGLLSRPARGRPPSAGRGGGWGTAAPRTPSVGGGYARPGSSYGRGPSSYGYGSSGDRAYSRQGSAEALERYRAQAEAARRQREAPPAPVPLPPPVAGARAGRERWGLPPARPRPDYRPDYGRRLRDGLVPRPWLVAAGGRRARRARAAAGSAGVPSGSGTGCSSAILLDNLTRAGSVDFFRNHRDDPGVREWREEAERQARDNAELRREAGPAGPGTRPAMTGQQKPPPRDPNYLPPDVPPEVALAPSACQRRPHADRGDGAGRRGAAAPAAGCGFPCSLVGGAGVAFLSWRRGRQGGGGGGRAERGSGREGAVGQRRRDAAPQALGRALRAVPVPRRHDADRGPDAVHPGRRTRPRCRRRSRPARRAASGSASPRSGGWRAARWITCGSTCRSGAASSRSTPAPDGQPDECRFFAPIDEVSPASEAEWGAWLDPAEGMIGWPEFQTKDGKLYGRAWSPGEARVEPRPLVETIEGGCGHAHRAQPGDALRRADRGGGAGAADRIHPGLGGGGGGAGLGRDQRGDRRQPGHALARLTTDPEKEKAWRTASSLS